ncbi:tRNA lysidine(34) synthetase TilS [Bosea sp. Tri-49]|uniref:tRNA lysidine(34) synthetase TilS n=1 Tax=Bosea sp. Tri-49 TaxID=1867715 RepID=UPI0013DF5C76|nr:tRNA lysidine(34) synthetase TilS [Bosea sp. Tri-49]
MSGGPDSVALLALLAEWAARGRPRLLAVTVDHGLRPEAAEEALMVALLCAGLGVEHRTKRWLGHKPQTGLQEKARAARYALLTEEAQAFGAAAIVTRPYPRRPGRDLADPYAAGSGLAGLAGMAARSSVNGVVLARPLLGVEKARLVATCEARGLSFVRDPSNDDPRFARIRWRGLLPELAQDGLTAERLGQLARRLARADEALDAFAVRALGDLACRRGGWRALVRFSRGFATSLRRSSFGAWLSHSPRRRTVTMRPTCRWRLARLEDCAQALIAATREGRALRRTLGGFRLSLTDDGVLTLMREGERRRGVHPATV